MFEGYGPNPAAIETLAKDGAKLIVTVDCGTTSIAPLAVAGPLGADVVVVDHHQADERLPDVAAVINPNRQDDLSGLGHLCAAGVTFMVLVATSRQLRLRGHYTAERPAPDLLALLDLVALATVCDVVPLKGLNRAFVTQGLQVMRQRRNVGLKALTDAAGLAVPPTPYHLGFVLGPRINAGGRIGDAALGARLLATDDEMEAARIAVRARQAQPRAQGGRGADARGGDRAGRRPGGGGRRCAAADASAPRPGTRAWSGWSPAGWSSGSAGRRAPSPGTSKDEGTGSLRSIDGVDIGGAVRAAVEAGYLEKGGGHAMAAGLTVARGAAMPRWRRSCASGWPRRPGAARTAAALDIDGALTPVSVTDELMALIDRAGPYGQGNPQPRFAFPAHRVKFAKVVGDVHVRCVLEGGDGSRLDAVAFRAADQAGGDHAARRRRHAAARRRPPAARHLGRPRQARAGDRGRGRSAAAVARFFAGSRLSWSGFCPDHPSINLLRSLRMAGSSGQARG